MASQQHGTTAFDALHSRLLLGFPALVARLGGDSSALLATENLACSPAGEVDEDVTYPQLIRLLEHSARELDCPDFGLRLARVQNGVAGYGPLGEVMRSADTLGDALHLVTDHSYAHSLATRLWIEAPAGGGNYFVGQDLLVRGAPHRAQTIELIMLLGHLGAQEITGGKARVRRVLFRHHPVASRGVYRRHFGCEVLFGQANDGVEFSARDFDQNIVNPGQTSLAGILAYINARFTQRRTPLHAQTRGVIMHLLGVSDCTNEEVARELQLHPRTLHRRLGEEGTSFQEVKNEVRRDVMIYYLQQTDFDFTLISDRLGFAEQSVMTRSCRRWLAASPTEVRAAARPR